MVKTERGSIAQLRRGVAEHCLLALLMTRERYGFELVRTMGEANLVASEGTVYPLLTRLAREGYVATTWRDSSSGPPRKYYSLTPSGLEALQHFAVEWAQFASTVDALMEGTKR